jgi:hypothetical protein
MVMAENFAAHHFQNRHEEFMQPTLVEKIHHHLDYKLHENGISE